mgnify:CR=1 FL=1
MVGNEQGQIVLITAPDLTNFESSRVADPFIKIVSDPEPVIQY